MKIAMWVLCGQEQPTAIRVAKTRLPLVEQSSAISYLTINTIMIKPQPISKLRADLSLWTIFVLRKTHNYTDHGSHLNVFLSH